VEESKNGLLLSTPLPSEGVFDAISFKEMAASSTRDERSPRAVL